jgi:hypothetical protein
MTSIFDSVIKCSLCNNMSNDFYALPCTHSFCKSCINQNLTDNILTCKTCNKSHFISNNDIDKFIKKSLLADFFVNLSKNHFDKLQVTNEEKSEEKGLCTECPPPPVVKGNPNSMPQLDNEPLLVTLLVCFHCKKKLCESCRNRHYIQQRQETSKLLDDCLTGSDSIAVTAEKLNEARKLKIEDYQKYKMTVNEYKIELMKRVDQEEKILLAKLDEEILSEKKYTEKFKF